MAVLTSKLIIELLDRATGPARAVAAAVNRLSAMQTRNAAALAATQAQMFGAVAAAYGLKHALAAPVTAASEFETTMLDIGQKADLSDEAIAALGKRIRDLAPIVNKSSGEVAKGVDALIGFGLDPDRAMALIEPIGKAATAYRAEVEDLAKAGYSALDNLKLPADQFGKALDAMAVAGKEGAFELKDMAREFPSLTAGAQALGMTGVTAVARLAAVLEIARKGAASGSEAATNTANLMQKIIAPDAVTKFKKVGIDIRAELKKTQKAGGDVFEMVDRLLKKATKGDQAKIVDFFADKQVLEFLRPLWQNIDEYKRIRDQALKATGVVEMDYKRRMMTNAAVTEAFQIRLRELGITIGNTLLPGLNRVMDALRPMLQGFERFAAANPRLVSGAIGLASALIGLRIAGIAAKYALLWLWGGALAAGVAGMKGLAAATVVAKLALLPFAATLRAARSAMIGFAAASAIVGTGGALKIAGLALLGLLNPLRLVTAALVALRFAVIGTGIGAVLLGIAAAGTYIYKNWSNVKQLFSGFGEGFMAEIAAIKPMLQPVIDWIGKAKDKISELLTPAAGSGKAWRAAGSGIGRSLGGIVSSVTKSLSSIGNWGQLGDTIGSAISRAVVGGVSGAIGAIKSIDWSGLGASIGAAIAGIDWGSVAMTVLRALGAALQASGELLFGVIRGLIKGAFNFDLVEDGGRIVEQLAAGVRSRIAEMSSVASEIGAAISTNAGALFSAGAALIQQLWEGMKSKVKALLGWIAGIGGQIRSAIGGASAAASAAGGGGGGGGVAGARAAGGPVQRGRTYLVGERGTELFTPDASGTILSAAATARALAAAVRQPPALPRPTLPEVPQFRDVAALQGRKAGGDGGGREQSVVNHNSFNVSVQAAPGQSTESIAEEVLRKLSDRVNALSRGSYSDGAYA